VLARALILGRHLFLESPAPPALTNIKCMQIFFFSFVAMILSGYQPKPKKNKINEMITGVGIPLLISKFVENFAMYFLIAREGIPLLILKILKKFAMYFLDCRSKHSTYNF
jgi:hypothetical protein